MLNGKELSCAYNFFSGYGALKLDFKGGWVFVNQHKETPLSDEVGAYLTELRTKAISIPGVGLKLHDESLKCPNCGGLKLCRGDTGRCISCTITNLSPRQKAIKEGKMWYTPAALCKVCGTLAERSVSTGACGNCTGRDEDGRATTESGLMREQPNLILSKKQAKAMGLKVYRTGIPCKKGHTGWRYVSTTSCIDCLRGVEL